MEAPRSLQFSHVGIKYGTIEYVSKLDSREADLLAYRERISDFRGSGCERGGTNDSP